MFSNMESSGQTVDTLYDQLDQNGDNLLTREEIASGLGEYAWLQI